MIMFAWGERSDNFWIDETLQESSATPNSTGWTNPLKGEIHVDAKLPNFMCLKDVKNPDQLGANIVMALRYFENRNVVTINGISSLEFQEIGF